MSKSIPCRADYRHFQDIPTRWGDQDSYGHINNAAYYFYFDTLVALFLAGRGLQPRPGDPSSSLAVVVETMCRFHSPAYFPDVLAGGLRVARIGRSSVRYEIGLFRPGQELACAEGHFVHVQVDAATQRQTVPVPQALRDALAALLVPEAG